MFYVGDRHCVAVAREHRCMYGRDDEGDVLMHLDRVLHVLDRHVVDASRLKAWGL